MCEIVTVASDILIKLHIFAQKNSTIRIVYSKLNENQSEF